MARMGGMGSVCHIFAPHGAISLLDVDSLVTEVGGGYGCMKRGKEVQGWFFKSSIVAFEESTCQSW